MKLRNAILITVGYILACILVISLLCSSITGSDTNRVITNISNVKHLISDYPDAPLPPNVKILPGDSNTSETRKIRDGANYAQQLSSGRITITSPIYDNAQITKYIQSSDTRTPVNFIIAIILFFAVAVYAAFAFYYLVVVRRRNLYTEETVAKIKNIERSPLTQSYLISENDDKITIALNKLGESIQAQALSHAEKKENLYEFIEFFQFPIFIYSAKGIIKRSNAAFQNEFSDSENLDIFSPYSEFLSFLVDKMLHPTMQEKVFYFEDINAHYQIRITPLPELESRFLVTMLDVTRYRQMVDAHNDFVADISHELKTPLTSIKGFAEIIDSDTANPEEKQEFTKIIKTEASRLTDLVQDILQLTKQNRKVKKEKLEMDEFVQTILNRFKPQIQAKNLTLNSQIEVLKGQSNPMMLDSILTNLISNAINYTQAGGKIYVGLHKEAGRPVFTVADNGPGLTELQKSRIFDRFYRTDQSRGKTEGTGLGLAIVQKNVQELGGQIDLVSVLDKGTTFTVTL
ncbi:sensor histidine kinase [Lactococcus termiticola]|nr:HAMP domain-containing sensor histidine kinase [Lactococcus termiticola]